MKRIQNVDRKQVDIRLPTIPATGCHDVPMLVDNSTKMVYRKAVHQLARYFRREFHYDFVQYDAAILPHETEQIAYLWPHPQTNCYGAEWDTVAVGAVCFARRDFPGKQPFQLQWIWIHPFERHQGLLTSAWPKFIQKFGQFEVEGPLSAAMDSFLKKHPKQPEYASL